MDYTGPLPTKPLVNSGNVLKSTAPERGLSHLIEVLHWIGEFGDAVDDRGTPNPGWTTAPDGWAAFNASAFVHELAGDVCADLLSYVLDAAGPHGLSRALQQLTDSLTDN